MAWVWSILTPDYPFTDSSSLLPSLLPFLHPSFHAHPLNEIKTLLSSGSLTYPPHRPLLAAWEGSSSEGGMEEEEGGVGSPGGSGDGGGGRRGGERGGEGGGGRLVVMGAAEIWADAWLDQEDNAMLADALFQVGKEEERERR